MNHLFLPTQSQPVFASTPLVPSDPAAPGFEATSSSSSSSSVPLPFHLYRYLPPVVFTQGGSNGLSYACNPFAFPSQHHIRRAPPVLVRKRTRGPPGAQWEHSELLVHNPSSSSSSTGGNASTYPYFTQPYQRTQAEERLDTFCSSLCGEPSVQYIPEEVLFRVFSLRGPGCFSSKRDALGSADALADLPVVPGTDPKQVFIEACCIEALTFVEKNEYLARPSQAFGYAGARSSVGWGRRFFSDVLNFCSGDADRGANGVHMGETEFPAEAEQERERKRRLGILKQSVAAHMETQRKQWKKRGRGARRLRDASSSGGSYRYSCGVPPPEIDGGAWSAECGRASRDLAIRFFSTQVMSSDLSVEPAGADIGGEVELDREGRMHRGMARGGISGEVEGGSFEGKRGTNRGRGRRGRGRARLSVVRPRGGLRGQSGVRGRGASLSSLQQMGGQTCQLGPTEEGQIRSLPVLSPFSADTFSLVSSSTMLPQRGGKGMRGRQRRHLEVTRRSARIQERLESPAASEDMGSRMGVGTPRGGVVHAGEFLPRSPPASAHPLGVGNRVSWGGDGSLAQTSSPEPRQKKKRQRVWDPEAAPENPSLRDQSRIQIQERKGEGGRKNLMALSVGQEKWGEEDENWFKAPKGEGREIGGAQGVSGKGNGGGEEELLQIYVPPEAESLSLSRRVAENGGIQEAACRSEERPSMSSLSLSDSVGQFRKAPHHLSDPAAATFDPSSSTSTAEFSPRPPATSSSHSRGEAEGASFFLCLHAEEGGDVLMGGEHTGDGEREIVSSPPTVFSPPRGERENGNQEQSTSVPRANRLRRLQAPLKVTIPNPHEGPHPDLLATQPQNPQGANAESET
uniref:Uncharacterized protein n=1 Tax=Chromera velia CCMP2878 TaxID=1169474 RepID=A0A0G4F9R3_9ALVE|eukprot:Cvel_15924.t1-p1 / transcript=Cvel_15924.t1 / gene=Cvel_15924 / organism=Chromera_velia_CCMP2878 / gene_product=hypothetical protein / transcript_product=hypothetical protein / location=Cvel_scaffold1204:26062-28626(-) / protein_length=855 / sequence_SO=supercontig / SO=protein_coding / is_pseudo=false